MAKTLVRFMRQHSDDDQFVKATSFAGPDQHDFFHQLVTELQEQGFDNDMALVKYESRADEDLYLMYAVIEDAPPCAELVTSLQLCYDQGAAGFFEIIMEGLN